VNNGYWLTRRRGWEYWNI